MHGNSVLTRVGSASEVKSAWGASLPPKLERRSSFNTVAELENHQPTPPTVSQRGRPRSRGRNSCADNGSLTLSESLRDTHGKLDSQDTQIRNLSDLVERLQNELRARDISSSQTDFSVLQRQASNLAKEREMEQMRNNVRAAEFALRGQEDELRAMKKRNMELEKASMDDDGKKTLEARLNELAAITAELRAKEVESKEKARLLTERDKTIKDLEDKLYGTGAGRDLESELREALRRAHSSEKLCGALEDKVKLKDNELKDIEKLRASERTLKDRASHLANKVHDLEDQLRARVTELKDFKDKTAASTKFNSEIVQLRAQVAKAEAAAGLHSEKVRSLEQQLAALMAENQGNSKDVADKLSAAVAQATSSQADCVAAQGLVADLDKQIKETRAELARVNKELETSKAAFAAAEEARLRGLKATEDREAMLKAEQEKRDVELAAARIAAESAAASAKKACEAGGLWEKQCADLKTDLTETKSMLAAKSQRVTSLEGQLEKAMADQGSAAAAAKALSEFEARATKAEVTAAKADARASAAEKEVTSAAAAAKKAQTEATAAAASAKAAETKLTKANSEVSSLRELLRVAEAARDKEAKAAKESKDSKDKELKDLEAQLKSKDTAHAKIVKQLETELERVRKLQGDTERELGILALSVKELKLKSAAAAAGAGSLADAEARVEAALFEQKKIEAALQAKTTQWEHEKAVFELKAQISRLQTLLRMAEITKLEEMLKATKRVEAVREELIGLLNYNLSAAEGQNLKSNSEAVQKQVRTREERLEALHKKAKVEEERIKQCEATYQQQTKRLKEKLAVLEDQLQALTGRR
mmetsp:Transcript_8842/g.20244  ORF Transcript_8842/g.20244 Transcript_8842/m.20244 type:complete len:826 (+) Transcript_8842:70-2547(+)